MEFKLNEYHRDISDEELLGDIRRIAEIVGTGRLSRSEYKKHGKYGTTTIERRFGGWNAAIEKIGLHTCVVGNQKHESLKNDESFFCDLRYIATLLAKDSITTGEYEQYGRFDRSVMFKKYGSWNIILQKAGLKPTPYRLGKGKEISDEELFQDIERVWIKLGRQPTISDVKNGEFKFSQNTFTRRFGGWRGALEAFIKYVNSDDNEVSPPSNNSEQQAKVETRVTQHKQSNPIEREEKVVDGPKNHKTNRDINLRLRFKVMARDNFKCCMCGRSPATDPSVVLHIDHIKPWAKGGETTMDNLQTLCSKCNLGKSDIML
ncbi:MAG: HNH endonuclease [Bacteroidales bacterium]|nr:HNH endonuclease [Bacteroidales bacterium]